METGPLRRQHNVSQYRIVKACQHCKLDLMRIQCELFEPVSIWFNPVWLRPHWFFNAHQCESSNEIRAWLCLVHMTLMTLTKKMDPVAIQDPQQRPRLHVLTHLRLHIPMPSSHFHNGSSHVVTWRRLRPTTFHSNPVQSGFNLPQLVDWLDAHSIRFIFFTFAVRTTNTHWCRLNAHSVPSANRP